MFFAQKALAKNYIWTRKLKEKISKSLLVNQVKNIKSMNWLDIHAANYYCKFFLHLKQKTFRIRGSICEIKNLKYSTNLFNIRTPFLNLSKCEIGAWARLFFGKITIFKDHRGTFNTTFLSMEFLFPWKIYTKEREAENINYYENVKWNSFVKCDMALV